MRKAVTSVLALLAFAIGGMAEAATPTMVTLTVEPNPGVVGEPSFLTARIKVPFAAAPAPGTPLAAVPGGGILSTGGIHTCALTAGGQADCWGFSGDDRSTPPDNRGPAKAVAAGGGHSCAIKADDTVACWGDNTSGQSEVPGNLGTVKMLSAGDKHTCAIKSDDTLACWGRYDEGQTTLPDELGTVKSVAAGGYHTCAIKTDDTVACWGYSQFGQSIVPVELGPAKAIASGFMHTCAIRSDDDLLLCWGLNQDGQSTPPETLGKVVAVAAGGNFNCALREDGSTACFGLNGDGQAAPPPDLGTVKALAAGFAHACASTADANIVCWGYNAFGQSTVPPSDISVGTFRFKDGGVSLNLIPEPVGDGQQTIEVGFPAGTHSLTVDYLDPSGEFEAATSPTVTHLVRVRPALTVVGGPDVGLKDGTTVDVPLIVTDADTAPPDITVKITFSSSYFLEPSIVGDAMTGWKLRIPAPLNPYGEDLSGQIGLEAVDATGLKSNPVTVSVAIGFTAGTPPEGGQVYGGAGPDDLTGQGGDDVIAGLAGADRLIGGSGDDNLYGGSGNDTLDGGPGDDILDGETGLMDTAVYPGPRQRYLVTVVSKSVKIVRDLATTGSQGVDTLLGVELASFGGGPAGPLTEAGNNHVPDLGVARMQVREGSNSGLVVLSPSDQEDPAESLTVSVLAQGKAGTAQLVGNAFLYTSSAVAGDKVEDTVQLLVTDPWGGSRSVDVGIDIAVNWTGTAANDRFTGGAGGDRLDGRPGDDVLAGGGGADAIVGGDGADTLAGGAGDDTLEGGAGKDRLTGGPGKDRFVIRNTAGSPAGASDTIVDFRAAEGDRVDLSAFDGSSQRPGLQRFTGYRGLLPFTRRAGQVRFVRAAGNLPPRLEGDWNGDGVADVALVLTGATTLPATALKLQ